MPARVGSEAEVLYEFCLHEFFLWRHALFNKATPSIGMVFSGI